MESEKVLCKIRKICVTLIHDGHDTICSEDYCHKRGECKQICVRQRMEHPSGEIHLDERIRPFTLG